MSLRLADAHDLDHILRMSERFHEVSPYGDCDFSRDRCIEFFDQYLSGDRQDIIIILAEDPHPYGMIVGVRSRLPFSESTVCTELAWWVDEDKRGKESIMLLRAYEEWSRRVDSDLTVVAMLNDLTDLTEFYKKNGYHEAEKSFVRKTNGSN